MSGEGAQLPTPGPKKTSSSTGKEQQPNMEGRLSIFMEIYG